MRLSDGQNAGRTTLVDLRRVQVRKFRKCFHPRPMTRGTEKTSEGAEVDAIMLDAIKAAKDYQQAFKAGGLENVDAVRGHRQALWNKLDLITVEPSEGRPKSVPMTAAPGKCGPDEPDEIWCWPDADMLPNDATWTTGCGLWSTVHQPDQELCHRYYREGIVEAWKARHRDVVYQRDELKAKLEGDQLKAKLEGYERAKNEAAKALAERGIEIVQGSGFADALVKTFDLAMKKWGANTTTFAVDTSAIKAPQSVLANGYCVKLPKFVAQHIGAEDGEGVAFWAHDTIDHAMVIVSNKTAAQKCGWDSPFEQTFPLGTLVRFESPEGPETGIIVNHEVDQHNGRDLLRLRLHGNRLGIVNPSVVRVAKAERCPHYHREVGVQCELEARHSGDHWASTGDHNYSSWTRDSAEETQANRLWGDIYSKMLPIFAKESPANAHERANVWACQAVNAFYNRPE